MKTLNEILRFYDLNIIHVLVFTVIFVLIFKRVSVQNEIGITVLNWIKWIVIGYGLLKLVVYVYELHLIGQFYSDPYYWGLFLIEVVVPLTLLITKFGKSILYLFLVLVIVNLGRYYELFVIAITTYMRDNSFDNALFTNGFKTVGLLIILQGLILSVVLILLAALLKKLQLNVRINNLLNRWLPL